MSSCLSTDYVELSGAHNITNIQILDEKESENASLPQSVKLTWRYQAKTNSNVRFRVEEERCYMKRRAVENSAVSKCLIKKGCFQV